jgi:crotonobetainyl-CoA:carnitine CoA-transferase CaiB-like acyl-CoA transferase
VMFALYHRDVHGGEGQVIDVSLFESLFSLLGPLGAEYAAHGTVRERTGNRSRNSAPRGCYRTSDGRWIAVSASTPKLAERFLRSYGLGSLLEEPRFATNQARVENAAALDVLVSDAIGRRTLAENLAIIEGNQLTAAPVQTIADIDADAHWRARDLLVDVDTPAGRVRMHNVVPKLLGTPGEIRSAGGALGADSDDFYARELGLSADQLQQLRAEGVI